MSNGEPHLRMRLFPVLAEMKEKYFVEMHSAGKGASLIVGSGRLPVMRQPVWPQELRLRRIRQSQRLRRLRVVPFTILFVGQQRE